jgi:hypothetical protein
VGLGHGGVGEQATGAQRGQRVRLDAAADGQPDRHAAAVAGDGQQVRGRARRHPGRAGQVAVHGHGGEDAAVERQLGGQQDQGGGVGGLRPVQRQPQDQGQHDDGGGPPVQPGQVRQAPAPQPADQDAQGDRRCQHGPGLRRRRRRTLPAARHGRGSPR